MEGLKEILERFDLIDQQFKAMNNRLDVITISINDKFHTLTTSYGHRFDSIDSRFDSIDSRFDNIDEELKSIKDYINIPT